MSILQPKALRLGRTRHFQQHGELQRLRVLCLVEDDTKTFFANSRSGEWMLQQFFRERDLIVVSDQPAIESKIEIITLHLCSDARCGGADPLSQRRKFFLPELSKPGIWRRETDRPAQIFPVAAETLFPFAQFRLRSGDIIVTLSLRRLRVDLSEIGRRTWRQTWHLQNSRARAPGQFHQ